MIERRPCKRCFFGLGCDLHFQDVVLDFNASVSKASVNLAYCCRIFFYLAFNKTLFGQWQTSHFVEVKRISRKTKTIPFFAKVCPDGLHSPRPCVLHPRKCRKSSEQGVMTVFGPEHITLYDSPSGNTGFWALVR